MEIFESVSLFLLGSSFTLRCQARASLPSSHKEPKGRMAVPNRMNFLGKFQGMGGVIFNPNIFVANFGNLKQGFLSMKLIQKSNFGPYPH